MKKIFLLSLLLSFGAAVYYTQDKNNDALIQTFNKSKYYPSSRDIGQKYAVDTCNVFVIYKYSYIVDTAKVNRCNEPMILEIGDGINRFYSRNSEIRDSLYFDNCNNYIKTKGHADGIEEPAGSFLQKNETAIYSDVYTYPKANNRTISLRVNILEYQYKEEIEHLNWNVLPETDSVLGYLCHKAETEFRGRKWHAWFTMEIPYNFGPWKLGGLPGLILKAEDNEGLFNWTAIGIEQPKNRSIYNYSEKVKPSFPYMTKFKIKECKRKDVAKLWRRQWVASTTMYFIDGRNPVINSIGKSGKITRVTIDMNNLPDRYYPKLELDM